MLRAVRRAGVSLAETDRLCPYKPRGIMFRLIAGMMRCKACPLPLADMVYRLARRLYVMRIR